MVARAPRKRMYRTMQGRMIDIEKLRGANEDVRAVGNMNVNARGDILGPSGSIATTNLPDDMPLGIMIGTKNNTTTASTIWVDYVKVISSRSFSGSTTK